MNQFLQSNVNGTFPPFTGEIKQQTIDGRDDMVLFPTEDKGRMIIDYDIYGRETEEEVKRRIQIAQVMFMLDVDRIKQEKGEYLKELVEKIKHEDELSIPIRVDFDKIIENWNYWTCEGRVTKMMIKKPPHLDQAYNLDNWEVIYYCDDHQARPFRKSVLEAMDHGDRYLVAWYALSRRWPFQYKHWEWDDRFKEVTHARIAPNNSDHYRKVWLDARDHGMVNMMPRSLREKWDEEYDVCPWADPGPMREPWIWGPFLEERDYPDRTWYRTYDHYNLEVDTRAIEGEL